MEYWDIYDKDIRPTGKTIAKGDTFEKDEYHIIVEAWIKTSADEFLIQRRSFEKALFPGMWYCSVSGSVVAGEKPIDGLIRETKEELGIDISQESTSLHQIITEDHVHFFIYVIDFDINLEDIVLEKSEVIDVDLLKYKEIKNLISEGKFIDLDYYGDFFRELVGIS